MLILSPSLFLKDSANSSLKTLCTVRRLFLLLGVTGLLAGTAAGAWLLGQCLLRGSPAAAGRAQPPNWRASAEVVVMGAPWSVSCGLGRGGRGWCGLCCWLLWSQQQAAAVPIERLIASSSGQCRIVPNSVHLRMLPRLCESTSTLFSVS